jgi:LDH2 family malate/lactate/ureidoglycolate dehydrogenase
MDKWIQRFRSASTIEGYEQVLIPGDPEREMESERLERGIPLLRPVVEDLQFLSDKFKIEL